MNNKAIKELISLANHLDSRGLRKEADYIDGIITKVHGKGPDSYIDTFPEEYSDLDETNITKDEAFSAGCSVCGLQSKDDCGHNNSSYMAKPQLYKIHEYSKKLHDMLSDEEALPDWAESHIAQMDQMIESVYHSYEYKKRNH